MYYFRIVINKQDHVENVHKELMDLELTPGILHVISFTSCSITYLHF